MPDATNIFSPAVMGGTENDELSAAPDPALDALAQEWARIPSPQADDFVRFTARCNAIGRAFASMNQRALVIQAELQASEMMADGNEVLLGGLRSDVFRAVSAALSASRRVFRMGSGDDLKLVAVLTRDELNARDPDLAADEERREQNLRAREVIINADGSRTERLLESFRADQIMTVTPVILATEIDRAAHVKKAVQKKRNGRTLLEWVRTDFPVRMAADFMSSRGVNRLPELIGVAHVPIMNEQGGMVAEPGYDPVSMRWISSAVPAVEVPENPTENEAKAALAEIRKLLRKYEFDGPRNEAAGAALVITAVLRPSMERAPMTLSTAGQPRTGKDHLLRTAALVSIGGSPTMFSIGSRPEEREKRLSQILHSGVPFIVLNNVNGGLESDDLCTFLSEGSAVLRSYGSVGAGKRAVYGAMIAASGNNLEATNDLVTRCFTVRQSSKSADPGSRTFDFCAHTWLGNPDNRRHILTAVFTIARWWMQERARGRNAGRLGGTNGFEQWSMFVREPIHALTGHDIFEATVEAEQDQRASEGPGAFTDACGVILTAAWRLDYPWSQRGAERMVADWRRQNAENLIAPDHIQLAESLVEENAGVLTAEEVCAAVEGKAPREIDATAGNVTRAAQKVTRFISQQEEDTARGGDEPAPMLAAWLDDVRAACRRIGKSADNEADAGMAIKRTLDVAGGTWRCTVVRDPVTGTPKKGGPRRNKAVYRWCRL